MKHKGIKEIEIKKYYFFCIIKYKIMYNNIKLIKYIKI